MNGSNLVQLLGVEADLPLRKAEEIVAKFFDSMSKALVSGDRIEIRGFGSFEVRDYGGYKGRNPKTGKDTEVLPKKLPFFRVGKEFRERLNQEKSA